MDEMLQNRIKSLLGGADMPNLMTTEMPSDTEMKDFSSVSVIPQSQNGNMVEGKDYLNIGGQFFWPWELESALPNGFSDTRAISRFLESLPEKPAIKELQRLQGIVGQGDGMRGGMADERNARAASEADEKVSRHHHYRHE